MSEIVSIEDLDYGDTPIPKFVKTKDFQNSLDVYIDISIENTADINKRNDTRENKLGDIGEVFVDNLQWVFSRRFYYYGCDCKRSYSVITHYKSPPYSPRGGVDKYISIIDEIGDRYNIAIEVKNWRGLKSISNEIFEKDILDRFSVCGENDYKVLAITRKNIPIINDRCVENNIRILPIEHHITPELDRDGVGYSLRSFFIYFDNMIDEIMYDRDGCIRKLYQCKVSVDILAKTYGLSKRQIYNIIEKEV